MTLKIISGNYKKMKAGVRAEYDKPELIIVNTPDLEALFGSYFPLGALNQGPFDRIEAIEEHENFKRVLKENCKEVYTVKELFLKGTVDQNNKRIEGESLEKLTSLARASFIQNNENLNLTDKISAMQTKEYVLDMMHPEDLVNTILIQPVVIPEYTGTNTDFNNNFGVFPVYNLMFSRDQQITTDKGVIIGNMNSKQRASETAMMKLAFQNLGVENVYEINNGAKLEGGDFIPAGDVAFIGQGLRTKSDAISQLLEKRMVGYDRIAIVKDSFQDQEEMHLDTYFNIVSPETVVILEDRINGLNSKKQVAVDIYVKKDDGSYELFKKNELFVDVLRNEGFNNIILVTKEEQMAYGTNFLTVAPNKVIGVDVAAKEELKQRFIKLREKHGPAFENFFDVSLDYNELADNFIGTKLGEKGIEYIPVKFNMLNMMYGSTHCATQVLKRTCEQ